MSLLPIAMLYLMLLVLQAFIAMVSPRRQLVVNLSIAFLLFGYVLLTGAVIIASGYAGNPEEAGYVWVKLSTYVGAAAAFDLIVVCLFNWAFQLVRNIDAIKLSILRRLGREVDDPEPASTGLKVPDEDPPPLYRVETANGPALRTRKGVQFQLSTVSVDRLAGDDYVINITGGITDKREAAVLRACRDARESTSQRVRVELNTLGGGFHAGYRIRAALRELNRHKPVIIHVVGECASIGVSILCAVPVAQRVSVDHATFLVHRTSKGANYRDEGSRICDELLIQDLVASTHVTEQSIKKLFRSGQDYQFDARRALALGFIGSIV